MHIHQKSLGAKREIDVFQRVEQGVKYRRGLNGWPPPEVQIGTARSNDWNGVQYAASTEHGRDCINGRIRSAGATRCRPVDTVS